MREGKVSKAMTERRILRKWNREANQRIRKAQKSPTAKTLQILASRTEEWQADLPGWLSIPAISCDLGNMLKANAAIAVSLETWQHLRVIAELASAGIDGPLGNQTRSAKELYEDMEWLRRFDEIGRLSARFTDWSSMASAKTTLDPVSRKARIESIKARYGPDEKWGPDGWARPDPTKGPVNRVGRAAQVLKAVRAEIADDRIAEIESAELDDELALLTAVLNAMSHGNTTLSMIIHAHPTTAIVAGTFCYLALQSGWNQLLTLTDGVCPSEHEEAARLRIDEVAERLLLK